MIKDFTTHNIRKNDGFVRMRVIAPDGRFQGDDIVGGLTHKSAIHKAKQYPKEIIICIFNEKLNK